VLSNLPKIASLSEWLNLTSRRVFLNFLVKIFIVLKSPIILIMAGFGLRWRWLVGWGNYSIVRIINYIRLAYT
jgi:hypothetical protein